MAGMARTHLKRKQIKNLITVGICIAPSLLITLIFIYFAFAFCAFLSLQNWNMLSPMRFIGLGNYITAFTTSEFWNSVRVTFAYVLFAVPICVALGLLIGLLLDWISFARSFFRLMLYLPVIVSMVVAATVWRLLFNPDVGQINQFLYAWGIKSSHWTSWWNDPRGGALVTILTVGIWKRMGYNGVLFLAGLKNISPTFYEAATIDGANAIQKFFRITLPLLSPTTFLVTMVQIIASFKVVESVMLMTVSDLGGPSHSTEVMVLYIYLNAFKFFRMGYASAISMTLFVIILLFTIVQLVLEKKIVHYQ